MTNKEKSKEVIGLIKKLDKLVEGKMLLIVVDPNTGIHTICPNPHNEFKEFSIMTAVTREIGMSQEVMTANIVSVVSPIISGLSCKAFHATLKLLNDLHSSFYHQDDNKFMMAAHSPFTA